MRPLYRPVNPKALVLIVPVGVQRYVLYLRATMFLVDHTISLVLFYSPEHVEQVNGRYVGSPQLGYFRRFRHVSVWGYPIFPSNVFLQMYSFFRWIPWLRNVFRERRPFLSTLQLFFAFYFFLTFVRFVG